MKRVQGGPPHFSLNGNSVAPDDPVFAREAAQRLSRRLGYLKLDPARILDAGCGAGANFALLGKLYPGAEIVGMDGASELAGVVLRGRSLAERIKELFGMRHVNRVCSELVRLPFAESSFGAVWSNVALSTFADPAPVFKEFHRVLQPGGLFAFSTYGPDTLKELKRAFSSLDMIARVRSFLDMHDLGDMLVASGYSAPVMDVDSVVFTYETVNALFADLRRTRDRGQLQRRSGLTGRKAWSRMLCSYNELRHQNRIPATIEFVFGHAWKPQRSPAGRTSTIRFHR